MLRTILNKAFLFVCLVLAQAVIFNNLILFNTAKAMVFIYLIIELPITLGANWMMTIGFLLGLSVDVFQDTPGLNALCCTIMAFGRRLIFHQYVPRDEDFSGKKIGIATLGLSAYLKYMGTFVLIYNILYFKIEAINYFDVQRLLVRILASSIYTFIVLYALDSLTLTKREKRL